MLKGSEIYPAETADGRAGEGLELDGRRLACEGGWTIRNSWHVMSS